MDNPPIDSDELRQLIVDAANTRMPFGKFGPEAHPPDGIPVMDLPLEYLMWFNHKGFPKGRLGELMQKVYELKSIGMDQIFNPMRQARGGRSDIRKRRPKTDF